VDHLSALINVLFNGEALQLFKDVHAICDLKSELRD
jgi:hypothetical protein